jgi:hypothetical protein
MAGLYLEPRGFLASAGQRIHILALEKPKQGKASGALPGKVRIGRVICRNLSTTPITAKPVFAWRCIHLSSHTS